MVTKLYASEFLSMEADLISSQPDSLRRLRREAMDRFNELGFPTVQMEDWKNTNVGFLTRKAFHRSTEQPDGLDLNMLEAYLVKDVTRVVFLNGRFSSQLSSFEDIPATVEIKSLSDAIHQSPERVTPYIAQFADYHHHAFVALNTAFMDDGVVIHIPDNAIVDRPIHVLYVFAPTRSEAVYYPRNLIYAGPNSQASIIEHYVGLSGEDYFTNQVTEIVARPNTSIHHTKLQQEALSAYHISTTQIHQHPNSAVSTTSVSIGSHLARNNTNVVLDGEGCSCTMNGLVLAQGNQHVDNHTSIQHLKPHSTSRELYKGIHSDRSHGVFHGRILVQKDAQKTNAKQTNKNLLLSNKALVNSNPQLEIYADDVRCTHGSTTGQVDQEAIFYLRSRGLDEKTAKRVLITGFAGEIIDGIQNKSVQTYLNGLLSKWLAEVNAEAPDG